MLSLGIDLSEDRVDLTLLRETFRSPLLKAKARFYLPQGAGTLDERRQYCAEKVRQFIKENDARRAVVIVGLPRRYFLMRHMMVPTVSHEDVNRIMHFEADQHIPWNIDDVYFDTIAPPVIPAAGAMEILFVAVKKEVLSDLLEPIRLAELQPAVVDSSTFAAATAYLQAEKRNEEQTAFVEIGEATAVISLLGPTNLKYTRTFSIAQLMEIGATRDRSSAEALAEGISHEIWVLTQSSIAEPGMRDIDELVVTGPGTASAELVERLEERMGLTALLFAPMSEQAEIRPEEAADMARSTCLALRGLARQGKGLNLLPPKLRAVRRDYGPYLAAGLALLILLQMGLLYSHHFYSQQLRRDALEATIEQLKPQVEKVVELEEKVEELEKRVDEMKEIDKGSSPRIALLKDLTQRIPTDAWLQSLQLRGKKLTLRLQGDPGLNLPVILEQSPFLADLKLRSSTEQQVNLEATVVAPGSAEELSPEEEE